jgi:hypothetical protein
LWGEDPGSGVWYLVKDNYIENIFSPDDMLAEVLRLCQGYNIVKRISDPHESWFIGLAEKFRITFLLADKSNSRKGELIKGLQLQLTTGKIKAATWCSNFINEIQSCQWSETDAEKIVNSSRYHILDAAQYFADNIPPYDESQRVVPWFVELRQKNEQRKSRNRQRQKMAERRARRWGTAR